MYKNVYSYLNDGLWRTGDMPEWYSQEANSSQGGREGLGALVGDNTASRVLQSKVKLSNSVCTIEMQSCLNQLFYVLLAEAGAVKSIGNRARLCNYIINCLLYRKVHVDA